MTTSSPAPPADVPRPPANVQGGWTGFFVVVWAACVGVPAAVAAGALLLATPLTELAALRIEIAALEEQLPEDAVVGPVGVVVDVVTRSVGTLQPWTLAVSLLACALTVAGLRLVAGSEAGRKATRLLLLLLAAAVVGAAVHLSVTLVPWLGAQAETLRTALDALADALGERGEPGLLSRLLAPSTRMAAIWIPAFLVGLPTALFWLAAGRSRLRAWCAGKPAAA